MRNSLFVMCILCGFLPDSAQGTVAEQNNIVWQLGEADNSSSEFALGPGEYKKFLSRDFGFEDRYYLIGRSQLSEDFPYVLPGPDDTWGGTWGTSGWRTHEVNILFGIGQMPANGDWKLIIDLVDVHPVKSLVKVSVNGQYKKFLLKGGSAESVDGITAKAAEQILEIPVAVGVIKPGGNRVTITILEGSWIVFDHLRLEGPDGVIPTRYNEVFIRSVEAANYEIVKGRKRVQPLLVDVEHLQGKPVLQVELDGKPVYRTVLDTARYQLEVPMTAVKSKRESQYRILVNGEEQEAGTVLRAPGKLHTPADYVDTRMGTAHSRWMIAPGPWMPFSMVKLSPDNQNKGWQAGYQPSFESVGCFSHIHEWTMAGLGLMPANGELQIRIGDQFDADSGYRSRIDKSTEEAPLGSYKVFLSDPGIWAEVTATTRCGFQRYTYPEGQNGRIMIDLHVPAEYDYQLQDIEIRQVSETRIEGHSHQLSPRPTVWSNDADQEYTLYFVIEFDQPIQRTGGWLNDKLVGFDQIKEKT